jgi:hypothetical protein
MYLGDPGAYYLPDVIVDLRNVTLTEVGQNRVLVQGTKGRAPSPFCKGMEHKRFTSCLLIEIVSGVFMDGFKVTGELFLGGVEAVAKAKQVGIAIINRAKEMLRKLGMDDFTAYNIEVLGAEHTYG